MKIRLNAQRLLSLRLTQKMELEKDRLSKKKQDDIIHAKLSKRTHNSNGEPLSPRSGQNTTRKNDDTQSVSSS